MMDSISETQIGEMPTRDAKKLIYVLSKIYNNLNIKIMRELTVSKETFFEMLSDLIKSGVTFEAEEKNNFIIITFNGGY